MGVRGGWLLLLLLLGLTSYDLGRISFRFEERPALSIVQNKGMSILLVDTQGRLDGIHQINDAAHLVDVIYLAGLSLPGTLQQELLGMTGLVNGKMLEFQVVGSLARSVEMGWMPAALRISLGIPLQVNQMSAADWEDLPGLGPALARRIEEERHKNGEFGTLNELVRVKGVGAKRIEEWRPLFGDG